EAAKNQFVSLIRNEMPRETYLQLADWYLSLGLPNESLEVLRCAPGDAEGYYWMAFLNNKLKAPASGPAGISGLIEKANALSPELVFPFRSSSADVLTWVIGQTPHWKPKYYLALILWS